MTPRYRAFSVFFLLASLLLHKNYTSVCRDARLPKQFDAVVYFDETRPVKALERSGAELHETPETYPFGV